MNIQEKVHKLANEKNYNEEKKHKNERREKRADFEKQEQTKNWSEEELTMLGEMTKQFAPLKVNKLFEYISKPYRKTK